MYRIFVIEDDLALARELQRQIERWGNEVQLATDFRQVMPALTAYDPHLVLVDIVLPYYNGYHWCSEIRKQSSVPVVFLSSAADNLNIVMAMNLGGDDFIPKPVDPDVLIAKLQAVLRRTYDLAGKVPVWEYRGAVLNLNDATLTCQGQRLELTRNEFRILQVLWEHRGQVVSRETLMTRLWQEDSYVEENTLTVNINRLRRRLAQLGLDELIHTRVGSGYVLE